MATQNEAIKHIAIATHTLLTAAETCLNCRTMGGRGSDLHDAAMKLLSKVHYGLDGILDVTGNPHLYEREAA